MKIVPFHDNVIVERDEADEEKTAGGLILAGHTRQNPDTAVVVSVGPGRKLDDGALVVPDVKPGDRVIIGRHSGIDANYGIEETVTVVQWGDILGIVESDG